MRRVSLCAVMLFLFSMPVHAQGDTVTRNPECVQLRRIWKLEGAVRDAYVGSGVGSVGDVNGDSIGDFAVYRHIPNYQWQVFYGSRDTISAEPVWVMDTGSAATIDHPVVGDFWGTGHRAVGFTRSLLNAQTSRVYDWLRIYRTDSSRLADTPSAVWYAVSPRDTSLRASVSDMLAVDLDGDGDDELIAVLKWVTIEGRYGQLWIYEGGPGFQVDTPSVVIKDPELNDDFFHVYAGHFDGDRYVDLMTVAQRPNQQGNSYTFYWGTGSLPRDHADPDRQLLSAGFSKFIEWTDCDGDSIQDLITPGILIWRSAAGKNPRERSWERADADIYLKSPGGQLNTIGQPGYLSSRRYAMVAGLWAPGAILFSGGPEGPDLEYDATYYPGNDGLQGNAYLRRGVGDVNGDGWDDAIGGNIHYPSEFDDRGIAIIVAGGPYIPNDDPALGVHEVALERKSNALSLWPNPVREELNIAWRGDLKQMLRRFEIHDMLGRLVASGSVPEGDGAALWRCAGQPAGAYLLSVFDATGQMLATTRFFKV